MTNVKNERGSVTIYFLGLLGLAGVIFLILTNMGKAFVVSTQASNAAEQAAFAVTAIYVERTKDAIEQYDDWLLSHPDYEEWDIDPIGDLVDLRHSYYRSRNYGVNQAYIMALNDVLPSQINSRPRFRYIIRNHIHSIGGGTIYSEVYRILNANDGDFLAYPYTEVMLSDTDWRIEVTTTIEFNRVADGNFVSEGEHKYERTGYGPKLTYLMDVY